MDKKRGIVLIFALLVTLVLSILLVPFFFQSISENQLATRFVNSTRAFWVAEAGIAKVLSLSGGLTNGQVEDGSLDGYNYYVIVSTAGTANYFTIESTGTVRSITRTVRVTVKQIPPDALKFPVGVETTTDLETKPNNIDPSNSWQENSAIDFADRFGLSKADAQARATVTNGSGNLGSVDVSGLWWINVTDSEVQIEHLNGSGILIVNGNLKITGLGTFNGIIYVIGTFTARGNPTINGAVLAESSADVGADLSGSCLVKYDPTQIGIVLPTLSTKQIVSWQEN